MAVDDHGIEVLKKAGEEVTPGSKANYFIKTKDPNVIATDSDGNDCNRVCKPTDLSDLFNLATIAGMTSGESFDEIQFGVNGAGDNILEFSLAGECQFQLVLTLTSGTNFNILKRACEGFLLQEDGDAILLEDGENLLAQGLI